MIGLAQRLVMHPPVQVALKRQKVAHILIAPPWPMVRRKHERDVVSEEFESLANVVRPAQRVACLSPSNRNEVVHRVRTHFGGAEPSVIREKEVHLCRRFGFGRQLEDNPHPIDQHLLPGVGDILRWCDQRRLIKGNCFAQTTIDMTTGAGRQGRAELVQRAPGHRGTCQQVLGDCFVEKMFRCNDATSTLSHILVGGDSKNSSEVIGVRVGVDHCGDETMAKMLVSERKAISGARHAGEWVDNNPTRCACNEGDVRNVVPPGLPNAGRDFEESVGHVELRLSPKARVDGVGRGCIDANEVVAVNVPRRYIGPFDAPGRVLCDQPAVRSLEVCVIECERHAGVGSLGMGRCTLWG